MAGRQTVEKSVSTASQELQLSLRLLTRIAVSHPAAALQIAQVQIPGPTSLQLPGLMARGVDALQSMPHPSAAAIGVFPLPLPFFSSISSNMCITLDFEQPQQQILRTGSLGMYKDLIKVETSSQAQRICKPLCSSRNSSFKESIACSVQVIVFRCQQLWPQVLQPGLLLSSQQHRFCRWTTIKRSLIQVQAQTQILTETGEMKLKFGSMVLIPSNPSAP